MVVGYALGNKHDAENEIQVLGEDDQDVLTYSKALSLVLSRSCRNECPYCSFHRNDSVVVPYSTIKFAKMARANGAREVHYYAGERPDKFPRIRATLDLWGFKSFLEYMYTVCELGFLEGLIPVLEVGFLSPIEMKKMSEICALLKIMLDSVDDPIHNSIYAKSPGKKFELRLRSLHWAGKMNLPVIAGLIIGIGEGKAHRKEALKQIAEIHAEYQNVHEVLLQNFVPERGTPFSDKPPPTKETMLETVELAKQILPEDVRVTIPIELNPDIEDFIRAGIRDLGHITEGPRVMFPGKPVLTEAHLSQIAEKMGFRLQQRFPLSLEYIKAERYSKKLGQVFDAYRYKIKKAEQEKVKALK